MIFELREVEYPYIRGTAKKILSHLVAACIRSGIHTMQDTWMGWFECIGLLTVVC